MSEALEDVEISNSNNEEEEERQEDHEDIKVRLDVTASHLQQWSTDEKQGFLDTLTTEVYPTVTTVHLSGRDLEIELTEPQIEALVSSIRNLYNVTDLFVFQGNSRVLNADLLAKSLPPNLTVLMLWHLTSTPESLAGALRQHRNLCRVTLNFPCRYKKQNQLEWGCLDVYAMAFCSMEHLEVLQIRCVTSSESFTHFQPDKPIHITQEESIITPDAIALLLNSTTIQHLYLENCGLLDDHMDIIAAELPTNKTLISLDLQNNNLFTEDIWYTTGRLLPNLPPQMTSMDISCEAAPHMSNEAGRALATGMQANKTLLSLELEGTWHHYQNEFAIPDGHTSKEWMTDVTHQLRINRAYAAAQAAANNNAGPWAKRSGAYDQRCLPPNPVFPNSADAPRKIGPLTLPAAAGPTLDVVQASAVNFVVALTSVSDHVSGLYHFLRTYPDHCDRLRAAPSYRGEQPDRKFTPAMSTSSLAATTTGNRTSDVSSYR